MNDSRDGVNIVIPPKAHGLTLLSDDFYTVRERYFKSTLQTGSWKALPGGVQEMQTPHYNIPDIEIRLDNLVGYRLDDGINLKSRGTGGHFIKAIDGQSRHDDEYTYCPSSSLGLLAVLFFLKSRGIMDVYFEAPIFFGTFEQAKAVGMRVHVILTAPEEKYHLTRECLEHVLDGQKAPIALIVTQPKYGDGGLRTDENLQMIQNLLGADNYLVIDEAADNVIPGNGSKFPSPLPPNLFRVRGIAKGLGLNGIKLSAIFHSSTNKGGIAEILEATSGSLDSYSDAVLRHVEGSADFLLESYDAARSYVEQGNRIAQTILGNYCEYVSKVESGYMGVASVKFSDSPLPQKKFYQRRASFLQDASGMGIPLTLGASLYYPTDLTSEKVRFNYFTSHENIEKASLMLRALAAQHGIQR